jgi:predicted ATPase
MIRSLTIRNYKSILDHSIELGRINVFIGENGCGKTNILEAVGLAGAALTDKLSTEELLLRGLRVAKPSIMRSAFPGNRAKDIEIETTFDKKNSDASLHIALRLAAEGESTAEAKWSEKLGREEVDFKTEELMSKELARAVAETAAKMQGAQSTLQEVLPFALAAVFRDRYAPRAQLRELVGEYAIYNANALVLRGLQVVSQRVPLGIHGERLDYAISTLPAEVWADVLERARCISWLENVVVDATDQLKYQGHKLGQSQSTLYFHDKHMRRRSNIFSAENVNEGILHVLFHLTLFVSEGTPKVLGIDNIDTAMNPQLCRDLMKQLSELAVKHDKQALITTHNPAILDGLNLGDDEQRLFVVYRNDDGHTLTRRISAKPQPDGQKLKLSELWMRGHIGGIPRNF